MKPKIKKFPKGWICFSRVGFVGIGSSPVKAYNSWNDGNMTAYGVFQESMPYILSGARSSKLSMRID